MNENNLQLISNDQVNYFFAGGFGGMCTVILGYPFDTIKVKLQSMPTPPAGEAPLYSGTWDCAVKTIKKYGILGLYKGMTVPIASVFPVFAISFLAFSELRKVIAISEENTVLTRLQLFGAGAFSGFLSAFVLSPGERIKCLLQVQQDGITLNTYKGPIDACRQLYREGGIRSICKGTGATLLRDIPGYGVYFTTYEWLQREFRQPPLNKPSISGTIVSGGMAGVIRWLVVCPVDTLKTRLQIAPEGEYPNGLRDVWRQLIKEEGLRGLYRGCWPVIIRSFPANATTFMGFELAMYYLNKLG